MTDVAATEREARGLLAALDEWTSIDVPPVGAAGVHKGSGEAASRVAEIRRRLIELGARFHRGAQGYELDALAAGPGAEGAPDATGGEGAR